jgi:hypothetical protein
MTESIRKFETERTRKFRAAPLQEADERTITHIETYGCSVVQVGRTCDAEGPGWSYTIGVYDTSGKPEIVEIGLPFDTAHRLLNEAANRLRSGVDLSAGRHRDMVGEVDCEFRLVDRKWVKRLMGWALWYYDGAAFPVLQAVYPDRENRYPEDPGFDPYFRQPLLQPDAPMTDFEVEFWDAADPQSRFSDWKFPDPPHTRVFLSEAVHSGAEPVTYVSHDAEDGAWQFLGDSMAGDGKAEISCLHHPIDKDPSLKELADLPLGWVAERAKPSAPWSRRPHERDESD